METISKTWREVKRLHLNYNMITSLYMMEPMERTIVNCFVILTLSLMAYSSWVYLPHYTLKLLVFSGVLGPATTTMAPAAVEGLGAEALLNFNTEL